MSCLFCVPHLKEAGGTDKGVSLTFHLLQEEEILSSGSAGCDDAFHASD